MTNWRKIGDAASAITSRISNKRADYDWTAAQLMEVCQAAIDAGSMKPTELIAACLTTLTYVLAQTDRRAHAEIGQQLGDLIPKIMSMAADAQTECERPLQ
jgi:hypothetical protein